MIQDPSNPHKAASAASTSLAGAHHSQRKKGLSEKEPGRPLANWAGNLRYSTSTIYFPTAVEEVQELVRSCVKLRVLGSRHSFNTIADSSYALLSLEEMNRVVSFDLEAKRITVEGGVRYGDIAPFLHGQGFALPNLASLPHITVAGACATATHGSGFLHGSLASSVSAMEIVKADGERILLTKRSGDHDFWGAVVHLGALGVVTNITLDLVPAFTMKQAVYVDLPMAVLEQHFHALQAEGYSVSLFTDWKQKNIGEVWVKTKDEESGGEVPGELFGAKMAQENLHPIRGESAENVTEQAGISGPWYERMPHFRMGFKPSAGAELQSEYFVPLDRAYAAMMAIEKISEKISPHLLISEIRTIAADEYWLSPFYRRPSVAFHFTWKQDSVAVMRLLPLIEEQLAPFHPRPHWGKLFTMPPSLLRSHYEKLPDFAALVQRFDAGGKFTNAFVVKNLFDQVT